MERIEFFRTRHEAAAWALEMDWERCEILFEPLVYDAEVHERYSRGFGWVVFLRVAAAA